MSDCAEQRNALLIEFIRLLLHVSRLTQCWRLTISQSSTAVLFNLSFHMTPRQFQAEEEEEEQLPGWSLSSSAVSPSSRSSERLLIRSVQRKVSSQARHMFALNVPPLFLVKQRQMK